MKSIQEGLDNLDKKCLDQFPNKVVRKSYASSIPEFKKLPTYVSEFLISNYADENGLIRQDAIDRIIDLMKLKSHEKINKEAIKSIALELGSVEIIDHFEVYTDLKKGKYFTHISILDEKATVNKDLILPSKYQTLLKGGLWGKAQFQHIKQGDYGSLNMNQFECYQTIYVILKDYIGNRKNFTTEEWINLLIRSIGYNPDILSRQQKLLYLARLLPMVEACTNLLELGPPSTGKSFIYENTSEYCRVLLGGEISLAKLIYDQTTRRIGMVFKKDVLCFDEINKANPQLNVLIPKFQQIMASNRVERGELEAITRVSLVFQGNIDFILEKNRIQPKEQEYLKILPKDMNNSAFLDRIHVFIHGWDLPKLGDNNLNKHLGLISNYFGQIMHKLRNENVSYLIDETIEFYKIDYEGNQKGISIRDKEALLHSLSGLIKLIFPNKIITKDEWREIVEFAIVLRQNVLQEIEKLDVTLKRSICYNFVNDIKVSDLNQEAREASQLSIDSTEAELESTKPLNYEDYHISLLEVYINDENYIVQKLPYWILKILIEEDIVSVDDIGFKVKKTDVADIIFKAIIKEPIKSMIMSPNQDYSNEEDKLDEIGKLLIEFSNIVKIYGKNLKKIAIIKVRSDYLDHTSEMNKCLEELEQKEKQIFKIPTYFTNNTENTLNLIITLIKKSRGLDPDLLSKDYTPILCQPEKILEIIKKKIDLWKNLIKKYESLQGIYKKLYINTKKNLDAEKKSKLIFQGKKFPLFAFDVNNLLISFKKKFPDSFHTKENPIERIKKNYLNKLPYLAHFFASAHLKKYLSVIPLNEYNRTHIENYLKNKNTNKFVDVDAILAGNILHLIKKHKDQISHFYLGCGDIDFHFIVEKANKYKIPVSIIVIDNKNLSNDLALLVPDTNIILLY